MFVVLVVLFLLVCASLISDCVVSFRGIRARKSLDSTSTILRRIKEDKEDSMPAGLLLDSPVFLSVQDMDDESASSKPLHLLSRAFNALKRSFKNIRASGGPLSIFPQQILGQAQAQARIKDTTNEDLVDFFIRTKIKNVYKAPTPLTRRLLSVLMDMDEGNQSELVAIIDEWSGLIQQRPFDDPELVSEDIVADLGKSRKKYSCFVSKIKV